MNPFYRLAARIRRPFVPTGEQGEDQAHRWLRSHGFTVVARNWRPPQGGGEIDIVAWEKEVLVFVEVKTRLSTQSEPERAVDEDKRTALRRAARDYVRRSGAEEAQIRFDLITISGPELNHLPDAFSL